MTELLQQAIAQVNGLPDSDQNAIANLIIQAITQQQRPAIDSDQSKVLLAQLATTRAEISSPKQVKPPFKLYQTYYKSLNNPMLNSQQYQFIERHDSLGRTKGNT